MVRGHAVHLVYMVQSTRTRSALRTVSGVVSYSVFGTKHSPNHRRRVPDGMPLAVQPVTKL